MKLFFQDPRQLLSIFTELENENLNLIQECREAEGNLEKIRNTVHEVTFYFAHFFWKESKLQARENEKHYLRLTTYLVKNFSQIAVTLIPLCASFNIIWRDYSMQNRGLASNRGVRSSIFFIMTENKLGTALFSRNFQNVMLRLDFV